MHSKLTVSWKLQGHPINQLGHETYLQGTQLYENEATYVDVSHWQTDSSCVVITATFSCNRKQKASSILLVAFYRFQSIYTAAAFSLFSEAQTVVPSIKIYSYISQSVSCYIIYINSWGNRGFVQWAKGVRDKVMLSSHYRKERRKKRLKSGRHKPSPSDNMIGNAVLTASYFSRTLN